MHIKGHAIRSVTAPSRPVTPTITNVSDTSLTFSWAANIESHVTSYNIMRSTDGTTYTLLVTDWPSTSYTDTNLTSGQIYYYRVASKSTNGQVSEFSFSVSQETSAAGQLTWIATPIPTIEFDYGVSDTFDLDPYITGTPNTITVETGSLPPNVTIVGQTLSYDGGGASSGNQQTGISLKLNPSSEADWIERISDPGVVWYHNFDTNQEVSLFAFNDGNQDPTKMIRHVGGGVYGGDALRIEHPVGSMQGPGWLRPFSPFTAASNGKGVNDPAANGTISLKTWNGDVSNWNQGFYGNSSYQTAAFDGTEYYVQYRFKISASRYVSGNPSAGKTLYLDRVGGSLQEIVIQNNWSYGPYAWWGAYTDFGAIHIEGPAGTNQLQYGGEWPNCGQGADQSECFIFSPDVWYTLMYRVRLGTENTSNTLFEAKVVLPGETSYRTIYSYASNRFVFSGTKGHNCFIASNYMNGQNVTSAWYQWYDEVIFSKNPIAAPGVAV